MKLSLIANQVFYRWHDAEQRTQQHLDLYHHHHTGTGIPGDTKDQAGTSFVYSVGLFCRGISFVSWEGKGQEKRVQKGIIIIIMATSLSS
jgi:hypothetical protein